MNSLFIAEDQCARRIVLGRGAAPAAKDLSPLIVAVSGPAAVADAADRTILKTQRDLSTVDIPQLLNLRIDQRVADGVHLTHLAAG